MSKQTNAPWDCDLTKVIGSIHTVHEDLIEYAQIIETAGLVEQSESLRDIICRLGDWLIETGK